MDRKISGEQIDKIAKSLVHDFALSDETLAEISESPKLWWNVKNQIEAEKTRRKKNWIFAFRPQIPAFGALLLVIGCGLAAVFLNSENNSNQLIAEENSVRETLEENVKKNWDLAIAPPESDFNVAQNTKKSESKPVPAKVSLKNTEPKAKFTAGNRSSETASKKAGNPIKVLPEKAEETKTDFIALSYAANTDSGQLVRVKVPSAMMISLGVATNIEKESKLVSAEVIIGDDGLARAIRFIR